jgi:hypothetical protein
MANGDKISCKQYTNFLVSQEPVFDKQILRDVRPTNSELMGYYETTPWDAYDGVEHTVDRFHGVFPNTTAAWATKSSTACSGTPCDPDENKIGWGNSRETYGRETQSWGTDVLCFDAIMTKPRAKEHFRAIIDDILRPATSWIMSAHLMRKAAAAAGKKFSVSSGLPTFTFSWDAGGYIYLTSSQDPTGRLTPEILRSRVRPQMFVGGTKAGKEGYDKLELHTDPDTFHYLAKQDPTLLDAWRFGEFGPAAKEYYKYGFSGYVGDFMVKCLQFPIRFNKLSAGRYQQVLPYKNVAATNGIKSEFNEDYNNAQYQWSYINNRRALRVMPFRAEALNSEMPFLVRDYGGKWKFATNDLGADCNGKAIDNSRGNKGKFYSDFDLAVKPEHPEWLELFFHKVDRPCITIVSTCNTDPGYPSQSYDSDNDPCTTVFEFTAVAKSGTYQVAADTVLEDGNVVDHAAINVATLALLVAALPAVGGGTWAISDATTLKIKLTGSTSTTVSIPFLL